MAYNNPIYQKNYQQSHKEQCRAYQPRWCLKHPSFVNWRSMMTRVYNPKHENYCRYGGKGIEVYNPWHDFATYEKEFGYTKPGSAYTVDRIDNDKGYEPGNVRWLLKVENSQRKHRVTSAT